VHQTRPRKAGAFIPPEAMVRSPQDGWMGPSVSQGRAEALIRWRGKI